MNGMQEWERAAAEAKSGGEGALLKEFAERAGLGKDDRERLAHHLTGSAYSEATMLLHRRMLPAYGFLVGQSPAGRGMARHWRASDSHARPFEAATPALALLRAAAFGLMLERDRDLQRGCAMCGGIGWTIARDGRKHLCRHGTSSYSVY